jgi:hypothetical protein
MLKPGTFLLLLVVLGFVAGGLLWTRSKTVPAAAPKSAPLLADAPDVVAPGESADDLRKQVMILEGQVEYLQGQVKALQDENSAMIDKMGRLGLKGAPMSDKPSTPGLTENEPPDYVSLGVDLLSLRKLRAVPIATTTAPQAEIEKQILAWLKRRFPGDESQRQSKALAALGAIPEPVDILPLRAALMVRQLGGWFDEESDTALLVDSTANPPDPPPPADPVLALAYGQLMRDFQKVLFSDTNARLTTDAQLAREALIGGDAALTRFLYSLQKPVPVNAGDLPPSDPDHPFNQVPLPVFLRELHLFATTRGFEFAQSLHSAGEFKQLTAAYSRPPASTAEVIDPEIYLAENAPPTVEIDWTDVAVAGAKPYWDDTLGRFAASVFLRGHNPDEIAFDATKNWRADRFIAFSAEGKQRDHAVWQTLWSGGSDAQLFFKALRNSMLQRYDQPADGAEGSSALNLVAQDRFISMIINHQGTGVLLIDAASEDFAKAAADRLNPQPNK